MSEISKWDAATEVAHVKLSIDRGAVILHVWAEKSGANEVGLDHEDAVALAAVLLAFAERIKPCR